MRVRSAHGALQKLFTMGSERCGAGTATRAGGGTACGVAAPPAGFNDALVTAGVQWPAPMASGPARKADKSGAHCSVPLSTSWNAR